MLGKHKCKWKHIPKLSAMKNCSMAHELIGLVLHANYCISRLLALLVNMSLIRGTTATNLSKNRYFLRNSGVESDEGSHLESLDAPQPTKRILIKDVLAHWLSNGDKM